MSRIIIADASRVTQAQFLRAILGPEPAPSAAERMAAENLARTVEERRTRFADRMENAGFKRPTVDELLKLFPEPLTEEVQGDPFLKRRRAA